MSALNVDLTPDDILYDCIVVGMGSMGSSALYHLSEIGLNVMGLDQFHPPHTNGSHSGQTRIIRKAYFEHPDYVPLLEEAYKGWEKLEKCTGANKLHQVGFLYMGYRGNEVMKGVEHSARKFNLKLNHLVHSDFAERYPYFHIPGNFDSIMEEEAGYVKPEEAIDDYLKLASGNGAKLIFDTRVMRISDEGERIKIQTEKKSFYSKKVIVSAGSWIKSLIKDFPVKLTVTRQLISWWTVKDPERFTHSGFPCWTIIHEGDPGIYYGFPIMKQDDYGNPLAFKVAHHTPGSEISPEDLHSFDPIREKEKLLKILNKYLPSVEPKFLKMTACLYTNSPDEHFIIDFLPKSSNKILIASGFSGHGFKFIPVIGMILRDLVEKEKTEFPIGLFGLGRV